MRFAVVVAGGVPNPSQSGSALTVWTVIRHLVGSGHEVGAVVLRPERLDDPGATIDERVEQLSALGADVRLVPSHAEKVLASLPGDVRSRLRRAWRPPAVELVPQLADADAVAAVIDDLQPDAAYVYHWEAVAATRKVRGVLPRFATVVDLPHLSSFYRWRAGRDRFSRAGVSRLLWLQARFRSLPRLMVELLNECEASANFAAHHAAWLRRHGAGGCEYYRTPIEDRLRDDLTRARGTRASALPRFLLIGHLRGASTLDGLDLFANSLLPRLEAALGQDGFEVRIAGAYDPPDHLRATLTRPSITFLGHLERADDEFALADALIVPTTIPLGTRVRIISAWSLGCPVVAHDANATGIPELANGENALLGRTADDLARALVSIAEDRTLGERLSTNGRQAYERLFAPSVAAARIEDTLRRIAAPFAQRVHAT